MWKNTYKDYRDDAQSTQQWVDTGEAIHGCEMHELNGWGDSLHIPPAKKPGILRTFLNLIFGGSEDAI